MDTKKMIIAIGNIMRELRLKKGYSIEYAAQAAGIPAKTVEKCENGLGAITFTQIWALSEVYEIQPNEIFRLAEKRI